MADANRPSSKTDVVSGSEGELAPGAVVSGRYKVVKKLDSGGMGTVYLVEHVSIQKPFALKVLFPDLARSRDLAARFLQEARLSSRIRHENVVDISDFGETEDGLVYFVMEYVEGANLDTLVRTHGPLPWKRALGIMSQVASALQAAHDRGIVHRDIKPANVIVSARPGRPDTVKVLDFGIAKVVDTSHDSEVITNRAIEVLGTPAYMAPEQGQGEPVDFRTDIYGCGCLLFHLLTGRPPFSGGGQFGVLMKQQLEPPPVPSSRLAPGALPPQVDDLVLRALAKDPGARWQTMPDFAAAIESAMGLPTGRGVPGGLLADSDVTTATLLPPGLVRGGTGAATVPGRRLRRLALGGLVVVASVAAALFLGQSPTPAPESPAPSAAAPDTPSASTTAPTPPPPSPPSLPTPAAAVPAVEKAAEADASAPRTRPARPGKSPRVKRPDEPTFEPLADPAVE